MPSKKRKYNARFPPGRIKKIMQTDEEVGKVAQAVPIIIYIMVSEMRWIHYYEGKELLSTPRTLELFVESLLSKAMQVTMSRSARTLSPSHVKQCILSEARFDFLRDLVKNIPDVSVAEEKEMVSAESSPNSSRFTDLPAPPRRIAREDSNSSSSCDIKPLVPSLNRTTDLDLPRSQRMETVTSAGIIPNDVIIDLSVKPEATVRPPNFYQETLLADDPVPPSVITLNPTYTCQPSTSSYANLTPVEPMNRVEVPANDNPLFFIGQNNNIPSQPIAPILNIDFSKNLAIPEIKVLDSSVAIGPPKLEKQKSLQRQNSKPKSEVKKLETKPAHVEYVSDDLQIDEDYDT